MGETMKGPAMSPVNVEVRGGGGGGGLGLGIVGGDEERWRHFDNSINAISFGFVATAILISMFLVMAIFERFLRPRSTLFSSDDDDHQDRGTRTRRRPTSADDIEAHPGNYARKLDYPNSPKMSIYAKGVSVLMPGNDIPTFIAHPAPAPCPPERISWPSHQHIPIGVSTSISKNPSYVMKIDAADGRECLAKRDAPAGRARSHEELNQEGVEIVVL